MGCSFGDETKQTLDLKTLFRIEKPKAVYKENGHYGTWAGCAMNGQQRTIVSDMVITNCQKLLVAGFGSNDPKSETRNDDGEVEITFRLDGGGTPLLHKVAIKYTMAPFDLVIPLGSKPVSGKLTIVLRPADWGTVATDLAVIDVY